jgi:hypothetical protein
MITRPDMYQSELTEPSNAGFTREDNVELQAARGILTAIARKNNLSIESVHKISWGSKEQWCSPGEGSIDLSN